MAFKTSSSDAVRKAGADGYAPGSERILAGVPAWPMLWPLLVLCCGSHGHRLALAVGTGHHPVGRQGDIPAADPVSGPEPRQRPIAVLGALRLQRPSPDRRPAGDDLLAALPPAVAAHRRAQLVGGRCDGAGHGVCRRRGPDAVVPRPGLALGRRRSSPRSPSATAPRWPGASSTSARC